MDNVAFHKNISVKEIIKDKGHEFCYLLPYSPFLNPIENMSSKFENELIRWKPWLIKYPQAIAKDIIKICFVVCINA